MAGAVGQSLCERRGTAEAQLLGHGISCWDLIGTTGSWLLASNSPGGRNSPDWHLAALVRYARACGVRGELAKREALLNTYLGGWERFSKHSTWVVYLSLFRHCLPLHCSCSRPTQHEPRDGAFFFLEPYGCSAAIETTHTQSTDLIKHEGMFFRLYLPVFNPECNLLWGHAMCRLSAVVI